MELSATGKVILGMLASRPRSGYEIKQLVDSSARFFWAASYGQIYPELKKLEKAGLITGGDSSTGARQRTTFELTADGRRAAREWIEEPPEVLEMRDEGLLKLFFPRACGDLKDEGGPAPRDRRADREDGGARGDRCGGRCRLPDRPPLRHRDERMDGGVVRARRR